MIKLLTREEKQEALKEAIVKITAGELINVVDASGFALGVCIGDFREIGWAERITTRDSMYWSWTGPNAIKVNGKVVQPNSYTEEIDMDWS